jgi:Prp8 binding protein
MSSSKRSASESFGSTQLVKRQKSDANLNGGAVAKVNGSGALIPGVSTPTHISAHEA